MICVSMMSIVLGAMAAVASPAEEKELALRVVEPVATTAIADDGEAPKPKKKKPEKKDEDVQEKPAPKKGPPHEHGGPHMPPPHERILAELYELRAMIEGGAPKKVARHDEEKPRGPHHELIISEIQAIKKLLRKK